MSKPANFKSHNFSVNLTTFKIATHYFCYSRVGRSEEGARIMLTTNINIQDRLITGQMGTVVKIQVNKTNKPTILYKKFDDENAGKTLVCQLLYLLSPF